jgi:hypothetical protein
VEVMEMQEVTETELYFYAQLMRFNLIYFAEYLRYKEKCRRLYNFDSLEEVAILNSTKDNIVDITSPYVKEEYFEKYCWSSIPRDYQLFEEYCNVRDLVPFREIIMEDNKLLLKLNAN